VSSGRSQAGQARVDEEEGIKDGSTADDDGRWAAHSPRTERHAARSASGGLMGWASYGSFCRDNLSDDRCDGKNQGSDGEHRRPKLTGVLFIFLREHGCEVGKVHAMPFGADLY